MAEANLSLQKSSKSLSSQQADQDLSLQKAFFYLECATIILTLFSQMGWVCYAVQYNCLVPISFASLAVALALSFVRPRSVRWRFILILIQAGVVCIACSLGVPRRYSAYYLVLAAKAAAFLPRTQSMLVPCALVMYRVISEFIAAYLAHEVFVRRVASIHFYNAVITEIELKLYFMVGLLTVIFLGRKVVSERRSRSVQQELTREKEALAIEIERNRVGREIHDSLGHTLASLTIQLEISIKLVASGKLEKASAITSECHESAIRCLQEVRRAVTSIRNAEGTSSTEGAES